MVYFTSDLENFLTGTTDAGRSVRPIETTTEDMVKKFHHIMLEDHRLKVCKIAKKVII